MSKKRKIELILESLSFLCDEKEELEKRVEELEKRVEVLEKPYVNLKPSTQPYWNPGWPSPYTITCTGTYKQ